ncbi:MAG TPA: VanZ family protein [Candidatus Acidoferrum sp.]|nr:VanZ family protein [Candidatus Acidoferrum sp.]
MSMAARPRRFPRIVTLLLFLLAAATVTVLSLLPQRDVPKVGVSDKLEHAIAYFGLAILGGLAFRERRRLLYLFVILCAMGGAIELLQAFSPGRTPELADAVADAAGAAAGIFVALPLALRRD